MDVAAQQRKLARRKKQASKERADTTSDEESEVDKGKIFGRLGQHPALKVNSDMVFACIFWVQSQKVLSLLILEGHGPPQGFG